MPDSGVDRALTDRGQTVNSFGMPFPSVFRYVYDAPTMPKRSTLSIALLAVLAAACLPVGAQTASAPANGIRLTATRVVGAEAIRITGTAPAEQPLEASLYVTYSRDIPTVLMNRRYLSTDATGRFDATMTTAPAFFRNAVVTVVLHALPAGPDARATFAVGAPNVPVPPDDIPASVR